MKLPVPNSPIVTIIAGLLVLGGCTSSIPDVSTQDTRQAVEAVYDRLDDLDLSLSARLSDYTSDAVILVPGEAEIRGHDAIADHLSQFGSQVDLVTEHQLIELTEFDDLVIAQGRVIGRARPHGQSDEFAFETKNIILLRRVGADDLKIWRVIYNAAPAPSLEDTPRLQ